MVSVDQELLKDIGFTKGPLKGEHGWGHQVWVYDGFFWVHFTETMTAEQRKRWPEAEDTIYVPKVSRKQFFKLFLETLISEAQESGQTRDFED